jgi:DMSO/TMAO reductase YedYZ molybdopterin-dependent catalytic subunit
MSEQNIIRSPDTNRKERVPPGQRLTERFPVLQHGGVPVIDIKKWTFSISGLVDPQKKLTYEEFMKLPRVKVISDIHCVTGWSRLDNVWEGVSTQEIKKLTRILPAARFIMVHAAGGFTTNLSVEDFLLRMFFLQLRIMVSS